MTPTETVNRYYPLLGGDVVVRVRAGSGEDAEAGERAALDELKRLESIFNLFEQTSALNRWRQGDLSTDLPPELVTALRVAQEWFEASGGAFHPATDLLRRRWLRADDVGELPTEQEMLQLASTMRELPYRVDDDGVVRRLADAGAVDLNAVARGLILDQAAAAALATQTVTDVTVAAGSTLRHAGAGTTKAALPGVAPEHDGCIVVSNQGLFTTGPLRPGFVVGSRSYPEVLDPRTGWPVQDVASVTVVGPDAMTAHLAATVIEVLRPEAAADVLAGRPELAFLAVLADSREYRSATWAGPGAGRR